MSYLVVFAAAFVGAMVVTPVAQRIADRLGMVSVSGGRRQHVGRIPQLGGLPLLIGYSISIGLIYWLMPPHGDDAPVLRGVVLGTGVMFLGGVLDDRFDLPAYVQYAMQFVGVLIAFSADLFLGVFSNPITGQPFLLHPTYPLLTFIVTAVWITGTMNAVNWLDGVDGLATGVGAIAALTFAMHAFQLEQTSVAAFPLALAGALLGFLPFNFAPARIYLGTAGVWILGYNLATLAILSPAKIATALLVLALPLLDGAWRIIDRLRKGRSPFRGDREHLHFLLKDRGWSAERIALSYYTVALIFGLVALFVPSSFIKLVILSVLTAAILGMLIWLTSPQQ